MFKSNYYFNLIFFFGMIIVFLLSKIFFDLPNWSVFFYYILSSSVVGIFFALDFSRFKKYLKMFFRSEYSVLFKNKNGIDFFTSETWFEYFLVTSNIDK